MINLSSRNKGDIKDSFDKLFKLVNINDNLEACNVLDSLEMNIKKYYISRGFESNGFFDVFYNIKYTLTHYTHVEWRRQEVYRLLEGLSKKLAEHDQDVPLKVKLSRLFTDIKDDFRTICQTGDPRDMDSLYDDFFALEKLSEEVAKKGEDVYKGYELAMQNSGKCQAALPKLMPQKKEKGRWTVVKETISGLTTSFELLYSSLAVLIASLDEPEPISEKNGEFKKLSEGRLRDMEEDKQNALKSEGRQLLKEGWPLPDIARRMDMTVDELCELLEIE